MGCKKTSVSKNLVRIAILAVILGFWSVYGENAYQTGVIASGATYGIGEASAGYFTILAIAYLLGWWVTRKIGMDHI